MKTRPLNKKSTQQMSEIKNQYLPTLSQVGSLLNSEGSISALQSASTFDLGAVLGSVAQNPSNRFYKNQDVYLDGYVFTNCCFSNCRLYTDSGIFALKACMIMQDCQVFLGPAAIRIIKLFNLRFPNPNTPQPVYNAENVGNGSLNIQ